MPSDSIVEPSWDAPCITSPESGPYTSRGGDGQLEEGDSTGRADLALRAKRKAEGTREGEDLTSVCGGDGVAQGQGNESKIDTYFVVLSDLIKWSSTV
jgi:hypothetical protein